ncbi:ABC transporter ATP-binding protein [Bradyrhizobium sp. CCGB12]|uniref:ABC transporter ATP-binding protein n=1 Tax=Bradyrhizobium sp. CCGB12 TaxID=2949632 RepID=UPI0020B281A7|nr:ATP-binding cassette domain-containing protein [Bradyrhizobium sp. CCGB12]MCP3387842.1 ABC transporter ATP-binding protein [Bradyrhizobium sp. CCGB12]
MLAIKDLHAYYGKGHILQGVSFAVQPSNIVSLLGRNGSGRSTTLKAIMGIVQPSAGAVELSGENLCRMSPTAIARRGIAYVPEERLVFSSLTVEQNLVLGQQERRPAAATWSLSDIFGYFPKLRERRLQRAGTLSGGEQQMLTIGRSLLGNPYVLLVDEPTEGLAPKIVDSLREVLVDIRGRGVAIVLVEQKLVMALQISERVAVMGHGAIVFEGSVEEFKSSPKVRATWLDVA